MFFNFGLNKICSNKFKLNVSVFVCMSVLIDSSQEIDSIIEVKMKQRIIIFFNGCDFDTSITVTVLTTLKYS